MHEPPHIHASGQGGRAKVWLETMEFAEHEGFKTSDLRGILEVVKDHRNLFLEAWNEFF